MLEFSLVLSLEELLLLVRRIGDLWSVGNQFYVEMQKVEGRGGIYKSVPEGR